MSTWKISKIDNKQGRVVMTNDQKASLSLVIPPEHKTHELKQAFIKQHCDAFDQAAQIPPVPVTRQQKVKAILMKPESLWCALLVQSVILLIIKLHGAS